MWLAALPLLGSVMGSQTASDTEQQKSEDLLRQQRVLAVTDAKGTSNDIYIFIGVFAVVGAVMFFALKGK
jgi:hypothetical protein